MRMIDMNSTQLFLWACFNSALPFELHNGAARGWMAGGGEGRVEREGVREVKGREEEEEEEGSEYVIFN